MYLKLKSMILYINNDYNNVFFFLNGSVCKKYIRFYLFIYIFFASFYGVFPHHWRLLYGPIFCKADLVTFKFITYSHIQLHLN